MPSQLLIRQLATPDAGAFRLLRLTGLQEAPTAFGSSYAAERDRTIDDFAQTIARNYMAGAFADCLLVGVAGFYPLVGEKMAHRGHVWGVYVDVAHRRRGIAGRLMENVLAHARTTVLQVHLAVVDGNQEALGLYRRLGFVSYGIEPRSLRVGEQFYDEHLMVWRADL